MNKVVEKAINEAIFIANESTQREIIDAHKARVSIYTKHLLPGGTMAGFVYSIELIRGIDGIWKYEKHTYTIPKIDLHLLGEVTPRIEAIE